MEARIALVELRRGARGTVAELHGGRQFRLRLESLGVRVGASVLKETDSFMRGPVAVRVGRSVIAIGHGMATRILIDTIA